MTKKIIILIILVVVAVLVFKTQMNNDKTNKENKENVPNTVIDSIFHASMILNWDGISIYTDPVSETSMFSGRPAPDIILITDIHGDHFDVETLKKVTIASTIIIAPQAVADKIPEELKSRVSIMENGEIANHLGFKIEAIPMYNLPGPSEAYHTKGRGNGYVIEKSGTRVYISGDTAGISEMRNLQNIDMAFIAMNLPYTMGVEEAAEAVLEFKPEQVYPYHYRTPEGFSDVAKFKELVNSQNPEIEVIQLDWYPK